MSDEMLSGTWRLSVPRLPTASWAWEFARRNEKLRNAFEKTVSHRLQVGASGNAQFFELRAPANAATPWPFLYLSSPNEDVNNIGMIWWPEHVASVVRAIAVPLSDLREVSVFSLSSLPLPSIVLRASDGLQHVMIKDGVRSLQLMVRGASLDQPVALLVDTADETPAFSGRQIEALACLRALLATGRLSETLLPPHTRSERLAFYREAFDGLRAGLGQKEIAVRLVGQDVVDRDWPDFDGYLRARVRYAMARGRQLVQHGYLELLR